MRTSVTLSVGSALLFTTPFVSAFPAFARRASVPEVAPSSLPTAGAATKIALHRRGSAELTREDGTADLGKAVVSPLPSLFFPLPPSTS